MWAACFDWTNGRGHFNMDGQDNKRCIAFGSMSSWIWKIVALGGGIIVRLRSGWKLSVLGSWCETGCNWNCGHLECKFLSRCGLAKEKKREGAFQREKKTCLILSTKFLTSEREEKPQWNKIPGSGRQKKEGEKRRKKK